MSLKAPIDLVQLPSAQAGNRRFGMLNALRAHTKAPYETDFQWKTLRPLKRLWAARTAVEEVQWPFRRELLLQVRAERHLLCGAPLLRERERLAYHVTVGVKVILMSPYMF